MEIKIKTKYELGQEVVAYNPLEHKLNEIKISEIQFEIDKNGTSVWYRDNSTQELFREANLFPSREAFIANL